MATGLDTLGGFGGGRVRNPSVGSIRGNQALLGRGQEAGFFDPFGSPRLRALRRRRALQLSDIQRQRAGTAGRLFGLDPQAQRSALIRADIGANQGLASGLLGSDVAGGERDLDFFRSLYGGEVDFQRQRQLQKQAEKAASRGGMGSAFGALVGTVPKFFGL